MRSTMNRVEAAITKCQGKIDALNGIGLNGKPLSELDTGLTFEEFVTFQNTQARAFASGKLTAGEAMMVYQLLGEEAYAGPECNGGWPKGVTMAQKIVVTKIIGELLEV